MKEIITCCGARYLPKMPSAHKVATDTCILAYYMHTSLVLLIRPMLFISFRPLFLPQEHAVVVSCEQDEALCKKAFSMSLPVVSTEFLLTGILQQKVDLQAYSLTSSLHAANQTAAPKAPARGRRK